MKTFTDFNIDIPARATGEIRTTCPTCSAHRRKASDKCLAINIEKETWFCHHCGWSGGLKQEPAKKFTPKTKTFCRPEYKPATKLHEKVIEYFKARKIPEAILEANRIGYGRSWKDKDGIQFPYIKDGQVVNVKHRSHEKDFRQEKEAEKCLYRFDVISKAAGDTLIITEGEIDALSFQTAGFEAVTSIPDGAPSPGTKSYSTKFDFLESAESILGRYRKIILAMDADAAGNTAMVELARRIGPEKCYRVTYPSECKDANDTLMKHGKAALKTIIEAATPYPVSGLFTASDFVADVQARYENRDQRGLGTGFTSLDELYTVKEGRLVVVTGIPGHGKSTLIDNIAILLAQLHGWKTAVFSPENWKVDNHISHLLPKIVGRPFRFNRHSQRMTLSEFHEGMGFINEHFFFIVPDEEVLSVDVILEKARIALFRYGVKCLIIDPWNEVEHLYNGQTEAQYLSLQLTKIRRFARQYGVHVWIIAHPRNLVKNASSGGYTPPTMYEISGGAHWRNKADIGLCVHRPDLDSDVSTIIIQKMRFSEEGKLGTVELKYVRETEQFIDF